MVLKLSILACLFATVAITQAVPTGTSSGGSSSSNHIDKRHKEAAPTLVPGEAAAAAAAAAPEQLFIQCILNYVFNAPQDENDQLTYQDLIKGCTDAVTQQQAASLTLLTPTPTEEQGIDPAARLSAPEVPFVSPRAPSPSAPEEVFVSPRVPVPSAPEPPFVSPPASNPPAKSGSNDKTKRKD